MEFIHRWIFVVLACNLGTGEVEVVIDHFKRSMAEYFPEWKYITAVQQVVYGEGMPAQVGVQSYYAWGLRQPCKQQFYDVLSPIGYGTAPKTRKEQVEALQYKHANWFKGLPQEAGDTNACR